MIGALLLSRARMVRRDFFSPPVRRGWARHPVFAVLLAIVLAVIVRFGLGEAFASIAAAGSSEEARVGMLALALTGALVALLAFDVDDVVRTLLLDPDLDLLRRAPRPASTLLAIKAIDAAPRTLLPLLVLAVPAIAVYLGDRPAPFAGAAVAVLVLVVLWAATLAAGVALSLAILSVVPAARAREALGVVSTLVFLGLWLFGTLVLPRAIAPGSGHSLTPTLETAAHGASPSAAAARAIAAAAGGATARAGWDFVFLVAIGLGAAGLVALAGRFALAGALERIAGASAAVPRMSATVRPRGPWAHDGKVRAILRRDGRMLRRSWTIVGDLLVASLLWALLPLLGFTRGEVPEPTLVRMAVLTIAVGLGYEVGARSIPFERRAGFWARVTPVGRRRYCGAKLAGATLVAAPIVLVVGTVLFIFAGVEPGSAARMAAPILGSLILSQSTGIWAGAVFGDPDWINPRAMLRFSGRMVAAVLVVLQLALWVGVLWWLEGSAAPPALWLAMGAAGAVLSLLPMWAASRRLVEADSPH